ncbi:MAG: carbohydrate binding domain-containing protein [Chloroflexota bacterium]
MTSLTRTSAIVLILAVLLSIGAAPQSQQDASSDPPDEVVKLIFIHHSTGENWLTDGYGDLGRTLGENNYFVSDTNYGWGPDGIGDRTDIPNWIEWFASNTTPTYMDALFNENEQHSSYTRTLDDPGGENEIIMFKSCFPNSALEGNPNDLPGTYEEMTVSGAKYVYNTILQYFGTRPDKLFIVITAPPLSDPTYAENARAFNEWLVNDWLRENDYSLNNVAVFDFYNVLTDPNAHHRVINGQIEHINGTRNTLYYPSGDDHPSEAGSRKATEEFVPLLNVFYHRWKENAPLPSAPTAAPVSPTESQPGAPATSPTLGVLADFDSFTPYLNAYWDEATPTQASCAPSSDVALSGSSSLKIEFDVTSGAWATCVLSFDGIQDWSAGQGLSFAIHSEQAGLPYDVDIYAGYDDARETYLDSASTPEDSVNGWATVEIPWGEFHRADWEADAGAVFTKSHEIVEIAFGFNGLDQGSNTGTIWIEDVQLMGAVSAPVDIQPTTVDESEPEDSEQAERPQQGCLNGLALPLFLFGLIGLGLGKQRKEA